jgi:hypothetical protein
MAQSEQHITSVCKPNMLIYPDPHVIRRICHQLTEAYEEHEMV